MISPALDLGAGLAAGLMIGIERGWRFRSEKSGSRVAGVRTFTLLGVGGAVAGLLGTAIHPAVTIVFAAALAAVLVIGFGRDKSRKDATGIVAALVALGLGALAGAGEPALGIAAAAVITLVLATREESHRFLARLNDTDVRAFARYLVITAAVLPFLPNRQIGPLNAWNPFHLWLVVVLVTGFSFLGYVANRAVGEKRGVLATAVIGGAYSSTAVTASLAQRLGAGENGPLTAGILTATGVMYVRVVVLVAILTPSTLSAFVAIVGPAALVGLAVAAFAWVKASNVPATSGQLTRNPIELIPALGFVAIVAAGAVATRWGQHGFGQAGAAVSLFITGIFDVDAAIVTLSGLPVNAIDRQLAAAALSGTVAANMIVKTLVCAIYARGRSRPAVVGLVASTAVLIVGIAVSLAASGFISHP